MSPIADRSIRVILRAEIASYKQAMAEAAASTKALGEQADGTTKRANTSLGRMVQSATQHREAWDKVGTSLTAAGGAVLAFGAAAIKTGVSYNTLQQSTRAALTSVLGSAAAANAQMDKLDAFARTSPFAKQTFITAQQQMLAFGIETKKVIPYLDAIQNAIAASGGSNQQLEEVAFVISQIGAAGKITATDLMQLGQRGINAAELIGSQMGMTGAEIRTSITNGTLDATAALDALAAGMQERYEGAADGVKNTFVGALDRVKGAWRDFGSELAKPLVDPNGGGALVGLLNWTADAMRGFMALPDPIRNTATGLTVLGAAGATATGSFMLMAPRIVDTIKAVRTLKADFPGASGTMIGLGKAAGIATAALTILATAGSIVKANTGDAVPGIDQMTRALRATEIQSNQAREAMMSVDPSTWIDKAFTSEARRGWLGIKTDMDGVASAAHNLQYYGTGATSFFVGIADALGMVEDPGRKAKETFANFDTALAQLVDSGNLEAAAQGAQVVTSALFEQGFTSAEVEDILSGYNGALELHGLVSKRTAEATGELASWQEKLGEELASNDPVVKASAEAFKSILDATEKATQSFMDYGDAVGMVEQKGEDARFSLDKWMQSLADQATAVQKWSQNIKTLMEANAPREVVQMFLDLGDKGAQALEDFVASGMTQMPQLADSINAPKTAMDELSDLFAEKYYIQADGTQAKDEANTVASDIATTGQNLRPWILDTDPSTAERKTNILRDFIGASTPGPWRMDADTKPAEESTRTSTSWISRQNPFVTVGADTEPAKKSTNATTWWIGQQNPFITVSADTSAALRSFSLLKSTITGTTVGVGTVLRPGGATGMRLPGFPTGGRLPGQPPANRSIDNLLGVDERGMPQVRVRSREWVVNEQASDYYGDRLMAAINSQSIPREALAGVAAQAPARASGGQVGTVAASVGVPSASDVTAALRALIPEIRAAVFEGSRSGVGLQSRARALSGRGV